ncbi:MAG: FHA domain-containing protein [Pirellula sp.]
MFAYLVARGYWHEICDNLFRNSNAVELPTKPQLEDATMNDGLLEANQLGEVAIQLLDTSTGMPLSSWKFQHQHEISIGRAPDQDVEINNPYVSRNHANVVLRDGQWILVSTGRNGVIVSDAFVLELPMQGEEVFRLGVDGPTLKFLQVTESFDSGATITFDTDAYPRFELDQPSLKREVGAVVEGEFFQNLQRMTSELRAKQGKD